MSWDELERRARQLARALDSSGVGPGRVWGVLARNRCEWAESSLGNTRAWSRIVPLNWHLTAPEIHALLVDSGAELLVVEREFRAVADEAARGTEVTRIIDYGSEYEDWLAAAGVKADPNSRK